ncbi:MAG: phage holin family protein [Verrucomicrobia bacterium]|nr:phage holin family protein [Verrucomicrobiota bacterium]MBV8485753.1 phage holin family protein [Verrucomicrobiota bacterium]
MSSNKPSVNGIASVRPVASWASVFLDYLDLKAHLLAVESREAVSHLTALAVIVGIVVVLVLCSALMYGAFLLFVIALLFHLSWGWSALICAVILTGGAILALFLLRIRLRKPVFQMTLKDLAKDREWLSQSKTKET